MHCGAGVGAGRTGVMSAAHLVRTGEAIAQQAALRTMAIGPPSIEQVHCVRNVSRDGSDPAARPDPRHQPAVQRAAADHGVPLGAGRSRIMLGVILGSPGRSRMIEPRPEGVASVGGPPIQSVTYPVGESTEIRGRHHLA